MFGMRLQKVGGGHVTVKRGDAGTIKVSRFGWFFKSYTLLSVDWQESGRRSLGKAAVYGAGAGILTGGIGLIIGALFGARRKDTSKAVLFLERNGKQHVLMIRCNERQFGKIHRMRALA